LLADLPLSIKAPQVSKDVIALKRPTETPHWVAFHQQAADELEATTSAGRAKKDWGSPGKVLMATEIKFLGRDSHPMSQNYQDI